MFSLLSASPRLCSSLLFAVLATGIPASLAAQHGDAGEPVPVTPDDLFRITDLADLDFHPGGRRLAFATSRLDREGNSYLRALWEADVETGELRQLTRSEGDRSPQWSPDGRWLAFLSSRGGSPQLWLLPEAVGEARPVTALESGVSGFAWAPDSRRLAVVSAVTEPSVAERVLGGSVASVSGDLIVADRPALPRRHRVPGFRVPAHLRRVDRRRRSRAGYRGSVRGLRARMVTRWRADRVRVQPHRRARLQPRQQHLDRRRFGWARRSVFRAGPGTDASPRWSPDGEWLAFRGNSDPHDYGSQHQIWLVGSEGGEPRNLTEAIDHTPSGFAWTPHNDLAAAFQIHGNIEIHHLALDGTHRPVVTGKGQAAGFDVAPDGGLGYLWTTPTAPRRGLCDSGPRG